LTQNQAFFKEVKKNIFAGLEAFFVPKMAQDTSLKGGQNISRGAAVPPAPPTSRAYATNSSTK